MRTTPGMPASRRWMSSISCEVGVAVGLDDEVRVQRQHLVLELALEAARHAEHDDQRRDPQHHAHRRHRREHGEHAQQKRHHGHQPAGEDADDARRLDDAVPVLRVREREHHEADRHQRQAGHQARLTPSANAGPRCR